ncbi:hypothetical protein [Streptomyces sp. NBC_00102]|uniref:hypothetical protein n=1 Tax=Streptomyces sp. NBC_00102 TaxID=2975652 RepID=UPI0022580DC4|nr:hypothetical protein [Streptomyces sp. NBC_00102]MCX5398024.1 hypothetical protein [Streptomyces sp. NBC_00102]
MRRRLRTAVAMAALGLALAGCGRQQAGSDGPATGTSAGSTASTSTTGTTSTSGSTGSTGSPMDAMDMQGAAERADSMLDLTLKAIEPAVRWAHGPTTTGSCDVTRRRTVMTVVAPGRRQEFLDRVTGFWRDSEYRIKAVNKDKDFPAVYAQAEGFGISVSVRGEGQVFFEVDSPCVRKSEVADSVSKPNGPSYEGVYPLPRPDVKSPYWSEGSS